MKVIIAGSRDIKDEKVLYTALTVCPWFRELAFKDIMIVQGGAPGVDALAKKWWKDHKALGVKHKEFKADWKRWGASAGPLRNREMARFGDALIAIPKEPKPVPRSGTWNMIAQARAQKEAGRDLPVFIWDAVNGREITLY